MQSAPHTGTDSHVIEANPSIHASHVLVTFPNLAKIAASGRLGLTVMEVVQEQYPDCTVEGVQTLEAALSVLASRIFDLVIADPGLPGFDAISLDDRCSVIRQVLQASSGAKHIVLTGINSQQDVDAMRALGIDGYAVKIGLSRVRLRELLAEVSPDTFALQMAELSPQKRQLGLSLLTRRERQVMELMMDRAPGQKRKDIYQRAAITYDIEAASAEGYYKSAVRKLRKHGHVLGDI